MPDHIVIPFGPRENRPHRTRTPRSRVGRASAHGLADTSGLERPAWNLEYVSLLQGGDGKEVAGISLGNLKRYYEDHTIESSLPNRLATLALQEARGLLERDIFYGEQSEDSNVTLLSPSAEGLVIAALHSQRKLNWLMHRLPQGSNDDFEQLQALPDWLTVHAPQPE